MLDSLLHNHTANLMKLNSQKVRLERLRFLEQFLYAENARNEVSVT